MKQLFYSLLLLISMSFVACQSTDNPFVHVEDGQFIKNNEVYNYIGTNYWYGAQLGADTIGGDRDRLIKELDFMKAHGVDNLRVLVGAEGPDSVPFRVSPVTIVKPGVYREVMLEGLDFLLEEMRKRDMVAVLFLTNNWEWSGGMAQYVNWNGYGEYVNPNKEEFSWSEFMNYQSQFYHCKPCQEQLNHFIKHVVTRTNTISGLAYTDDPAIMSWELANEPRPMHENNGESYVKWIKETAALIKSFDANHLVTTGSEGEMGSNNDIQLFKEAHALPEIDYLTFHIWVKNWKWYDVHNPDSTMPLALERVQQYIDEHVSIAEQLNKPLILEEFGLARDNEVFNPGTSTQFRDTYYDYAFSAVVKSVKESGQLVGANFWAFGGYANPIEGQEYWKIGDQYSGDPPQEEQGLNAVYASDESTMAIIKGYNQNFGRIKE